MNNSVVGNKTYVPHPREAAAAIGEGETVPARLPGVTLVAEARGGPTTAPPHREQAPPIPRPNLKIIRQPRHARWPTAKPRRKRTATATRTAMPRATSPTASTCSWTASRSSSSRSSGPPACSTPRSRPPAQESDRRNHRGLPPAHRVRRADSRHHIDQTHGGRLDGLPERRGLEGALSAQRHRHDRARRNPARIARGGVRYPGGNQSLARRSRPAGSVAGVHPRRGQGGVSAQPDLAHPDGGARGAARQRARYFVRGHGDAKHAQADRRVGIPAQPADGVQHEARHHPAKRAAGGAGKACT